MTEKLLLKPPFRYLHDIFTATMQATGFGGALFSEVEMDGKANHDKDTKVTILAKMVTLTEMIVGEKIDVKPTKIVAGLEPEATNMFLQYMFKAATSGVDSTPFCKKINGEADEDEDDGAAEEEARQQAEAEARAAEEAKKNKSKAGEDKKK